MPNPEPTGDIIKKPASPKAGWLFVKRLRKFRSCKSRSALEILVRCHVRRLLGRVTKYRLFVSSNWLVRRFGLRRLACSWCFLSGSERGLAPPLGGLVLLLAVFSWALLYGESHEPRQRPQHNAIEQFTRKNGGRSDPG